MTSGGGDGVRLGALSLGVGVVADAVAAAFAAVGDGELHIETDCEDCVESACGELSGDVDSVMMMAAAKGSMVVEAAAMWEWATTAVW